MQKMNYLIKQKSDEEDEEMTPQQARFVIRRGSHIYFYDEIDQQTTLIFMQLYEEARAYIQQTYANSIVEGNELPEIITVHINSPGGLVSCSLALYDFLEDAPIPCVGIVEGMAASGASIMLCGCIHRAITKHSSILIHELRGGNYGKYSQLQDWSSNHSHYMNQLKEIYLEKTKIPAEQIDQILSHDIFWGAKESLEFGIVDQIVGEEPEDDKDDDKKDSGKKPAKKAPRAKGKITTKKESEPAKKEATEKPARTKRVRKTS